MSKRILTSFLFTLALILSSCSSSDFESHGIPTPGSYSFYFTDSMGVKISEGVINIDSVSGDFRGTYDILKVLKPDYPGVLKSNGIYAGSYNKTSTIYGFNMNPKVADANVLIAAVYSKGRLRGTWVYSTMIGVRSKGIFQALIQD